MLSEGNVNREWRGWVGWKCKCVGGAMGGKYKQDVLWDLSQLDNVK